MGFLSRVLHLWEKEKTLEKVIADFNSTDLQDAIEMLEGLGESSKDHLFVTVVVLDTKEIAYKDVQIKGNPGMAVDALCHLRPGETTGLWAKSVKTYSRADDALGVLFDLMCFQHWLLAVRYDDILRKVITLFVV